MQLLYLKYKGGQYYSQMSFFKQLIVLSLSTSYYCTFTYQDLGIQRKKQHSIDEDILCLGCMLQAPPGLLQLGGGRGEAALCFSRTGISTGKAERHLQLSSSGQTAQGTGYAFNI